MNDNPRVGLTTKELRTVQLIAERVQKICTQFDLFDDAGKVYAPAATAIVSCLIICHKMVIPLRLGDMLYGSDEDLIHDVIGIYNNIEIKNFSEAEPTMENEFKPRFANDTENAGDHIS